MEEYRIDNATCHTITTNEADNICTIKIDESTFPVFKPGICINLDMPGGVSIQKDGKYYDFDEYLCKLIKDNFPNKPFINSTIDDWDSK